jgi:hypothetical protein
VGLAQAAAEPPWPQVPVSLAVPLPRVGIWAGPALGVGSVIGWDTSISSWRTVSQVWVDLVQMSVVTLPVDQSQFLV